VRQLLLGRAGIGGAVARGFDQRRNMAMLGKNIQRLFVRDVVDVGVGVVAISSFVDRRQQSLLVLHRGHLDRFGDAICGTHANP
jgi:hypothetical protein